MKLSCLIRSAELKRSFPVILLFSAGIFLRLIFFLDNRSLGQDEAWRALDTMGRSWQNILFAQNYSEPIPVGFACTTKFLIESFGYKEYVLRSLPLIFGIMSIFLFYAFLKKHFTQFTALLGLAFFSFSPDLIHFSAEFKQYSLDVLISLLFLLSVFEIKISSKNNVRFFWIWAGVGATSIWFSYISIFWLASIGLYWLMGEFSKKRTSDYSRRKEFTALLSVYTVWITSFLLNYFLILKRVDHSGVLEDMWKYAFWPWPIWSFKSILWFTQSIKDIFRNLLDLNIPWVGIMVSILGILKIFRESRSVAFMLGMPLVLVLLSSALHQYPFSDRCILFLVPGFLVCLSEGIKRIFDLYPRLPLLTGLLVFLLFLGPVQQSIADYVLGGLKNETRDNIKILSRKQEITDLLLLNNAAQYAYQYYLPYFNSQPIKIIAISSDYLRIEGGRPFMYVYYPELRKDNKIFSSQDLFQEEMATYGKSPARGRICRIWVLLSESYGGVADFWGDVMDHRAKQIQAFHQAGSSLYLYEMN